MGEGAFGTTYIAIDTKLPGEPKCVIKQLLIEENKCQADSLFKNINYFKEEAKILFQIKHPQIPKLLGYYEENLCSVQEFIEGKTLWEEFQEQQNFEEDAIWEVLESLLPVLEFIHDQKDYQIIHRDIGLKNIIRRNVDQKLVLIDFGLAKQIEINSYVPISIKQNYGNYPLPNRKVTEPSLDFYSLGALCFHLLSGMDPDYYRIRQEECNEDGSNWTFGWRSQLYNNSISDNLFDVIDKLLRNIYKSAKEAYVEVVCVRKIQQLSLAVTNWTYESISEHNYAVCALAITSDNKLLISGDQEGNINLWNLLDKKLLYSPQTQKESISINSIAVSPDANKFVSAGSGVINLWDLETKPSKLLCKSDNKVGVNALAFHPKGDFIACAGHRTINLWLSDITRIVRTFYAYENNYPDDYSQEDDYDDYTTYFISCINFSPCGRLLAAGLSIANKYGENELGNNIKIWDIYSENMFRLPAHASPVKSVVFSPDGNTLASGNYDGTIKLWDVRTRKATRTIQEHIDSVCALAFSSDGQILASGDNKGIIQLWCPYNGRRLECFKEHTDAINSLVFSTDSKTLVSASSDGYIMIRQRD